MKQNHKHVHVYLYLSFPVSYYGIKIRKYGYHTVIRHLIKTK